MDIYSSTFDRPVPQSEKADARQVANSAGGHVFQVSNLERLRRFLTLGSEGGTYYVGARELTKANAESIVALAKSPETHTVAVDTVVAISTAGRAPKANPALFALAVLATHGAQEGRAHALEALPQVARIGTHLFLFVKYLELFGGWSRAKRRAVARWYTEKDADDLAYQMVKYRQREGWSHRDVLRMAHPHATSVGHHGLFDWACDREPEANTLPMTARAFDALQTAPLEQAVAIVASNAISWEMLPDRLVNEPSIWRTLIAKGMPITALIRQLPRLTRLGVLDDPSMATEVVRRITDQSALIKGRVHPINLLVAHRTYAGGRSERGSGEWTPNRQIVDALDSAFYLAFGAVEPMGKRVRLALDVSGSMTSAISGMPLTCREASAALALVTVATEPQADVVGFTGRRGFYGRGGDTALTPLSISPRQRLADAVHTVSGLPFGTTDCALPITDALEKGLAFDLFVIYTDNETWSGGVHPHVALKEYRRRMGIDAKLVVVGMTATNFSIADPTDAGMLDVAGFDSAVPSLISDFGRGR